MVDQKEYYLKSIDKLELFARSWSNERIPKGLICIIPGLGDHSGRFDNWAKLFVGQGFAVTSFDIRGNGKSQGKKGHASSYDMLLNDIDVFFKESGSRFPGLPVFLYGHSLGGNLAINYVIKKTPKIKGLIVTSPWLKLNVEPGKLKLQLGKMLQYIMPWYTFSSGLSRSDFNGDANIINSIDEDPYLHNKVSIKLYLGAVNYGMWALKNIYKVNVPFLIMYGKEDRISSHRLCEEYIINTSEKTKLVVWEGSKHNLYLEPSNLKIHQSIVKWLEEVNSITVKKVSQDEFIPNRS